MDKKWKIAGIGCGCAAVLLPAIGLLIFIIFIGIQGPETSVYIGNQMPKDYMSTVKELGLLEKGEKIKYFYSDSLIDITDGMYFVTDRHVVLYSNDFAESAIVIPFDSITDLEVEYDNSFWDDTMIYITTDDDGIEYALPVSSENGLDKKFFEAIKDKIKTEENTDSQ